MAGSATMIALLSNACMKVAAPTTSGATIRPWPCVWLSLHSVMPRPYLRAEATNQERKVPMDVLEKPPAPLTGVEVAA